MSEPLISVIMAVYNGGQFLHPAIASILQQTHRNLELIITDDCSSDGSVDVIEAFSDSRIRFVQNQSRLGLAGNRNKALSLVRGEYVAVMDNDDISQPERLIKQLQAFELDSALSLCGTYAEVINEKDQVVAHWQFPTNSPALKAQFYLQFPIVHSSAMFRVQNLKKLSKAYDLSLEWAEDYDLLFRLIDGYTVKVIPEYLVRYRIHPQNHSLNHKLTYKHQLVEIYQREYHKLGLVLTTSEIRNFALFLNPNFGPIPKLWPALRTCFHLHSAIKNCFKLQDWQLRCWNTYVFKTFLLNCLKLVRER